MLYNVYYEETYGGTYIVEASSEEEAKEKVLDGLMEGSLDGPEMCQSSAARVSKIIDNRTDVHNIYDWICSCDWRK